MLNHWYIAANSEDLINRPLECKILNESIVVFRDKERQAVALVNRCPHRNAELSKGRIIDGNLMCPYHGWEFNGKGKCVYIPSLCENEKIPSTASTGSYPVIEQDSYIWIWMGNRLPESYEKPFKISNLHLNGWHSYKLETTIKNSVDNVIENFIDSPHTGYIHGGLFRSPASHVAKTHVKIVEDGVIIDIEEDNQRESILSRLLMGDNKQIHQDRFIMPSIVKVSYSFGDSKKMVGYHICTPIDDFVTKLYVNFTWNFGWLSPIVGTFAPFFGNIILKQDKNILDNQGNVIKKYGENFVSSPADTANVWIKNFRQKAKRGEKSAPREKNVDFML